MPIYRIDVQEVDLPRKIALLDTNVLVSFADPDDPKHQHTTEVIDLGEYTWVVLYTVVIESWNFIRGKLKKPEVADYLLRWILTPGTVYVINEPPQVIQHHRENIINSRLDFVDAALMKTATDISLTLNIRPYVHVATYDLRDFARCRLNPDFSFHVYDMEELTSSSDY